MDILTNYREMRALAAPYIHRPDIVQSAGGNFSVKFSDTEMLIKASGRRFGQIHEDGSGIAQVSFVQIKDHLVDPVNRSLSEAEHTAFVRTNVIGDLANERPSMEVWFHTLLPKYVLHTHAAQVNVLSCAEEGEELFAHHIAPLNVSFGAIKYCNPGFELGTKIADQYGSEVPQVLLLENHGIIVSGNSVDECVHIHDRVVTTLEDGLSLRSIAFEERDPTVDEQRDLELPLFPDQVIYPEDREIQAAHRYIVSHIRRLGLTVRTMPMESVGTVASMDAEKHRRDLQQQ